MKVTKLQSIVKLLREVIGGNFQLSQVEVLLAVMAAHPEPISYKAVEQLTGLPQTSVARNLRIFGTRRQRDDSAEGYHEIGLGLLTATIDPFDTRRYAAQLSKKGVDLLQRINKLMEG